MRKLIAAAVLAGLVAPVLARDPNPARPDDKDPTGSAED